MPVLQLTVTVELDGKELTDLSLTRRLTLDNATAMSLGLPSVMSPVSVPAIDRLSALNALVIRATDQAVILRTDSVTISPGGIAVLFDVIKPTTEPIQITQNSGSRSTVKGLVAGAAV